MGNIATGGPRSGGGRGISPSSFVSASVDAAVDFLSVAYLDNQDEQDLVPNLIDCAVALPRPDVHAVKLLFGFEFLHTMVTPALFHTQEIAENPLPDVRVESRSEKRRVGKECR